MMRNLLILSLIFLSFSKSSAQKNNQPKGFTITAYYAGNATEINNYPVEKLTHVIFSFCHLKNNRLSVNNASDSLTIQKLVSLKNRNPQLKILLSLGGWGGCKNCSQVFSSESGRKEFARSTKELTDYFKSDGIDLDWEYPVIEGFPGHAYSGEDKNNFTSLVKELRKELGKKHEISFAAGGFTSFLEQSIDWKEVIPVVDRVNLMSYDLINGNSTVTGHHTALFSTPSQKESADNSIKYLDSIGVPLNKIVIGAAFYARIFENVAGTNNGLYQKGKFKSGISYRNFDSAFNSREGYVHFWDETAEAPYYYNADKKLFATGDDEKSIRLKTKYAKEKGLNGIMFWELLGDRPKDGLVEVIFSTSHSD
jgi:chitinase